MGRRGWLAVIAVVVLFAALVNLWRQNGRLRRGRARAVAALAEAREGHTAPILPRRGAPAEDVQAAALALLPAPDDDGAGAADDAEPPPPERHWAVEFFTPHAGENLMAYRDRVLPVVQAVAAPQRKRVRRWREQFAKDAQLSEVQERALDATVADAGEQIKDRIYQGVLSGELGARTKASSGVAFARDVLDLADRANQRFRAQLSASQAAALDAGRFDVVDYLFFATRWEDLLGVEEH